MVIRVQKNNNSLMFTAMKKIYQTPDLHITEIAYATLIADSIGIGEGTTEDGGWVKERHEDVSGGNGRGGSYNVWGDDWSN